MLCLTNSHKQFFMGKTKQYSIDYEYQKITTDKKSTFATSDTALAALKHGQHAAITSQQSSTTTSSRRQQPGPLRNFVLIWLDQNVDETMEYYQRSLIQLREIVFTILLFKDINQFMSKIKNIKSEEILLIVSGAIGKSVVPQIHHMVQLNSIFIFCRNKHLHTGWTRQWSKVQCVSTEIQHICKSLRKVVEQIGEGAIHMSFVPKRTADVDNNLDQLEPSYMYTMLFKDILMEIEFDEKKSLHELVTYCRDNDINESELNYFRREYFNKSAIWWYTYEMFVYAMLNKSLRDLDMEIMVKMGFIIRKLFLELRYLYNRQKNNFAKSFMVYRGQGMTPGDFQHLLDIKGGLLAFNCFLSTITEPKVAISFIARNLRKYKENVGVVFHMTIDQTKVNPEKTPFAEISEFSAAKQDNEILFSMHTVFRVNEIKQSAGNKRQWDVQLMLTDGNDPQLGGLVNYMKKEIDGTGWFRMGKLMLKVGDFEQAEGLYNQLLEDPANEGKKMHIYHMLGVVKGNQGRYKEAIQYYEKSLEMRPKTMKEDDISLANTYNNIGLQYNNMSDFENALKYYQIASKIKKKSLSPVDPDLVATYNDIGKLYNDMGEYSKAFEHYEKSLKIREKVLPPTHTDLATSYNNIGKLYNDMGEYSKAFEHYEKSLKIREKVLPPTHTDLATSYNNIGKLYNDMGEYSKAFEHYEKSLKIREKVLPPTHTDLATSYNNIGQLYNDMGEYSRALDFYEKSLKIREKSLLPTHPDLAISYNNIGQVCSNMGEYSRALDFYEKSLKIRENSLPQTHPDLGFTYFWLGRGYKGLKDYSKALDYFEKAIRICEKSLGEKNPYVAITLSDTGDVHRLMGAFKKALEFHRTALNIQENVRCNPLDCATTYVNLGETYREMNDYPTAFTYYQKGFEIREKKLPKDHPDLAVVLHGLAKLYSSKGDYRLAMKNVQQAIEISQMTLPSTHPHLVDYKETLEKIRKKL